MPVALNLALDCNDLAVAEAFWAAALGYRRTRGVDQYVTLGPPPGEPGILLLLQQVPEPKSAKNRMHLDLDVEDVEAEVARLEALGATRVAGPIDQMGHHWIVMADPEGNEFCVCAC